MAQRIVSFGTVTVTTAGTRVQVSSTELSGSSIIIQADELNTGKLFVGDSDVDSTDFFLHPGQSLPLGADSVRGITEGLFLSDIFLDAENDGNAARIIFIKRR